MGNGKILPVHGVGFTPQPLVDRAAGRLRVCSPGADIPGVNIALPATTGLEIEGLLIAHRLQPIVPGFTMNFFGELNFIFSWILAKKSLKLGWLALLFNHFFLRFDRFLERRVFPKYPRFGWRLMFVTRKVL